MTNEQLVTWVKEQMTNGKTKEQIQNELLQAGWDENVVKNTLSALSNNVPKPPQYKENSNASVQDTDVSKLLNKEMRLDKRAVWLFFLKYFFSHLSLFAIFITVLLFKLSTDITDLSDIVQHYLFVVIIVLTMGTLLWSYVYAYLYYRFYKFTLTDTAYKAERGIIFKRYVTIPYSKIQNVDVYRGLLARMLGLSDLNIQTAGYGASGAPGSVGSEGRLPGVDKDMAEEIRDLLVKLAEQQHRI